MYHGLIVNSWVAIREGCPMSCDVLGSGETHFLCGSPTDGFEFSFDPDALRVPEAGYEGIGRDGRPLRRGGSCARHD